jgi:hypothetical protein
MNAKAQAITDPIVQQDKFQEIQEVDNRLDALFEAAQTAKKELCEFKPAVRLHMFRCTK